MMGIDVLILNTAVVDFRSKDFTFAEALVGEGGLAKCQTADLPDYSQQYLEELIAAGHATAGGPGNSAPLIARAGIKTGVGVNLGKGEYNGLDIQGSFFYQVMTDNHVDMSATVIHPSLPTGTTFIYEKNTSERGGIAFFPNANHDFDFEHFKAVVKTLQPRIVYYMYSGLSDRADANGGRDLASFIKFCRDNGAVTIADSHTLAGNPQQLISRGAVVEEYKLLAPLLPELDIFFTSYDEARMIANTLGAKPDKKQDIESILDFFAATYWDQKEERTKLFGITVSDGAWWKSISPEGSITKPEKTISKFMDGEVVDLVGAGDSFRSGLITYLAANINDFHSGNLDFSQAVQMGNLFASCYIKAPVDNRYCKIQPYQEMLKIISA